MTGIKHRLAKLEASALEPAQDRITEIQRVIVGQFNRDGTPCIIMRRFGS